MALTKEQMEEVQEYLKTIPEAERKKKEQEIIAQLEKEEQGPPQCPFCLMVEGKIETTKVHEDSNFLAVLEINPANKGHTIITTKRHIKSLSELSDDESEHLGKLLKKLSAAISKISGNYNILISEGKASGSRFDHLTINLIPRTNNDKVNIQWQPNKTEKADLEKIKQEIMNNIPKDKPKAEPVKEDDLKAGLMKMKKRLP